MIVAIVGFLPTPAGAQVAPDRLYQALLQAPLANAPPGQTATVSDLPVRSDAASLGLVGAVRIAVRGGPAGTRITYYVFTNPGRATAYNLRYLAMPPRSGMRIPYPPNTQCDETANGGGYCNMVVPEHSVAITTESSAPLDSVSGPLMGIAFDHLYRTANAAGQSPPTR